MICPRCGHNNPPEGTQDGGCENCGYYIGIKILTGSDLLNINLASLEQRLFAQILDTFFAFSMFFAVILIAFSLAVILSIFSTSLGELIIYIGGCIGVLVTILYILLADGLKNGQSYGKRLVKIAVIDLKSRKYCTFRQSLVRNLLLSFIGIIDFIFIIFSDKQQRLGDMIANTIVIKKNPYSGS